MICSLSFKSKQKFNNFKFYMASIPFISFYLHRQCSMLHIYRGRKKRHLWLLFSFKIFIACILYFVFSILNMKKGLIWLFREFSKLPSYHNYVYHLALSVYVFLLIVGLKEDSKCLNLFVDDLLSSMQNIDIKCKNTAIKYWKWSVNVKEETQTTPRFSS